MGLASAPEALEHGDTGREFHGGGGDPPERRTELGHLRHRARHGTAEQEHPQQQGHHTDQGEAPVDREQVGQCQQRGGEYGDDVEQGVGEQRVQRAHVVLHRLFHLAGALVGEPAERQPPDVPGEPTAEGELELVVGEVREGTGRRSARQGEQARHTGEGDQRPEDVTAGGGPAGEAAGDT